MHITASTVTHDDAGGCLVVVADLSGLTLAPEASFDKAEAAAHTIIVPCAAIADRMRGYGLATEAEALEAIMREHALRLSTLTPTASDLVATLGGLDDRITVSLSDDHVAALDAAQIEPLPPLDVLSSSAVEELVAEPLAEPIVVPPIA